jgi:hypothetical protein
MLNFNEMLQAAYEAMKKESKMAELYQAFTGKGMKAMQVIFRGDMKYPSYVVLVDAHGNTVVKGVSQPYMDDLVIKVPLSMTQEESEQALNNAGYTDWVNLTLRAPLYSIVYPPLYIYDVKNVGYMAVDSTDGSVFQLY